MSELRDPRDTHGIRSLLSTLLEIKDPAPIVRVDRSFRGDLSAIWQHNRILETMGALASRGIVTGGAGSAVLVAELAAKDADVEGWRKIIDEIRETWGYAPSLDYWYRYCFDRTLRHRLMEAGAEAGNGM